MELELMDMFNLHVLQLLIYKTKTSLYFAGVLHNNLKNSHDVVYNIEKSMRKSVILHSKLD